MAVSKSRSVFEVYAHEYDLITNAAQREKFHRKEIDGLINRFKPDTVLDAGCATGLTSILFARRGVETVGLDRSRPMLHTATAKAKPEKLPLQFLYGNFERLPKKLHGRFDLVVCLANSISGVGSLTNLTKTLKNFHNIIRPGGHLVLQMLNYKAIKEAELFPIKATENNGIIYERFSERRGSKQLIYVSRLDLKKKPSVLEVFRHEFDNFAPEIVHARMDKVGYKPIRKYGNLLMDKRFTASSRDLVLVGRR